jgi:hypothetical protein
MRQMALADVGIARLDLFHVANDIKAGTLVALLEEHNPGDIENFSAVYVPGGNILRPRNLTGDLFEINLAMQPGGNLTTCIGKRQPDTKRATAGVY